MKNTTQERSDLSTLHVSSAPAGASTDQPRLDAELSEQELAQISAGIMAGQLHGAAFKKGASSWDPGDYSPSSNVVVDTLPAGLS